MKALGASEVLMRAGYAEDSVSRSYYAVLHAAKSAMLPGEQAVGALAGIPAGLREHAEGTGRRRAAEAVRQVVDGILSRPEHLWFTAGAAGQAARIRGRMQQRYGDAGR